MHSRKLTKELIYELLANGKNFRQNQWTKSIAVGSKGFIETIKEKLGILVKGQKILEIDGGFHLREEMRTYVANSDSDNGHSSSMNDYYWDVYL